MQNHKLLFSIALSLFMFILFVLPASAGVSTLGLESMNFLEAGEQQLEFGAGYESGRVLYTDQEENQLEYDRYKIAPVEFKVGLFDSLEVGFNSGYILNSTSSGTYPERDTVKGIDLFSRVKWHKHIGTSFRLKFAGDPALQPYGSDRVQLKVNFPMTVSFAEGNLNSEVGYTFASGDVEDLSGNELARWTDYFNFGVGYSWKSNNSLSWVIELLGHGATAEFETKSETGAGGGTTPTSSTTRDLDFEDHLELVFGPVVHFTPQAQLKPALRVGLLEGSPDFALDVKFSLAFGGEGNGEYSEEVTREPRYSDKKPVGHVKPRRLPPLKDKKSNVKKIKNEARQAYNRGNLKKAIRKYKKVIPQEPDNANIFSNLGSLYYRQKNYLKARDFYRRAVQLAPNDALAHQYLGATYYQLGEWDRARKHFRRVLEIQPENQEVKRWLRQLK